MSNASAERTMRIGIPIIGGKNWLGGITYLELLVKALRTLPKQQQPELYLVATDDTLPDISLHEYIIPYFDKIIYVGKFADAIARQNNGVITVSSNEELFTHIDFYYPVNSNVLKGFPAGSWIPDFQHVYLPEFFTDEDKQSRDASFSKIAQEAKLVIFSSKDAEKDFWKFYPDSKVTSRILSFHTLTQSEWLEPDPREAQRKYALPDEFLISCNQFWQHKNHILLFQAIADLRRHGRDVHIVCTGSTTDYRAIGYFAQVEKTIAELGIGDLVHILGNIPRMDQIQLIRRAMAVVQPSLFEGWSTVVEDCRAMGKTMVLSDLPVNFEQNPKHSVYFDRASKESLAQEILKLLPLLKAGPDHTREREATQDSKANVQKYAQQFMSIAREGMEIFKKKDTALPPPGSFKSPSGNIRVSALVSTYNAEKFFKGRLEDLVNQTLFKKGELEIIIIDSGSPTNERAIAEEFQKRFKNIIYQRTERETIYAAWNRAVNLASGKYLTNANTDDRLRPDALEIMADTLDRESAGLAYCDSLLTWGKNETFKNNTADRVWVLPEFNTRQALLDCPFGCQVMWRRQLHETEGMFDPAFKIAGDYEFFLRVALRHGAFHIAAPLALYHESPDNLSYQDQSKVMSEVKSFLPEYQKNIPIENIYEFLKNDNSPHALTTAYFNFAGLLLGEANFGYGDPEIAEYYYRKALELNPGNPVILNNLACALCAQGNRDSAAQVLKGIGGNYPMVQRNIAALIAGHETLQLVPVTDERIEAMPALQPSPEARIAIDEYMQKYPQVQQESPREDADTATGIDAYIEKRDGNFLYISADIYPQSNTDDELRRFIELIATLPPYYLYYGGVGDGLLTLASFYDNNPHAVIVCMSNSPAASKSFLSAFPGIRTVYLFPPVPHGLAGLAFRSAVPKFANCLGVGVTPPGNYEDTWKPDINIFKSPYNIAKYPRWAQSFKSTKLQPFQVVLAPKGSVYGTFRSKRNTLDPKYWPVLLEFLKVNNIRPVVIGTPDENTAYPLDENCIDRRSWSFKDQMEVIASADLFIGADSWGKTFSAMAGIPTVVFKPMMGPDLVYWQDNSDFVFIKPWENIALINNLPDFLKVCDEVFKRNGRTLILPQSERFLKAIGERKPLPDPQQMTSFDPIFWTRDYKSFKKVLVRSTPAIGDALMLTAVVRSFKKNFPAQEIYVSGDERAEWIFKNNPYIAGFVKLNSNEELRIEASAEVIECNHIIDRLPEYYNGLHYMDILGNIAGVQLDSYELDYQIENDEKIRAEDLLKTFKRNGEMLVGVQLTTNKDVWRSYTAPDFLPKLFKEFPQAKFILFGQETPGFKNDNFLDCAEAKIEFRDQVALAAHCDTFITIDSAFYHIGHNLFKKPTLLITSVTNEALIGNPGAGLTYPVRNAKNGCFPCYWQKECKRTCLKELAPDDVVKAFKEMLVKVQRNEFPLWKPEIETVPLEMQNGENYQQKITSIVFKRPKLARVVFKSIEHLPHYATQWNGIEIAGHPKRTPKNTFTEKNSLPIPNITMNSLPPNMEYIACPYCHSTQAEPYRSSADIVRCLSCHTVYLRTRLTTRAMEELYQSYADGDSHMALPKTMSEIRNSSLRREGFMQEILEFVKPHGTLLDVGCGWGALLDNAREKGFQPAGLELTRKCVDFAGSQLNIPVKNTQFLDTDYEKNSLAVVTMLHVLEHLPQPREAVEKVFQILEPGGVFCGIVPNIESLSSQALKDEWYWLDPNYHYVHYSPETLRKYLENAGFIIEKIYTTSGDFGTDTQIGLLKNSGDPKLAVNPEAVLAELEKQGLGEEIRFFARKPGAVHNDFKDFKLNLDSLTIPFKNGNGVAHSEQKEVFKMQEAVVENSFKTGFASETFKSETVKNEQKLPQINLVWEGSQFVNHSLALINREHASNVIKSGVAEVTVVPYEPDQFAADGDKKLELLKEHDVRFKKPVPEAIAKLPYAWVRHQWPPKAEPPRGAKWIIMQPWEYSSVPTDFINIFKSADEIWTPSNFARNAFVNAGVDFDKVQIVPNGINPDVFTPSGNPVDFPVDKRLKFLFVGGTIFRKGIDVLLKAYTQAFTAADDVCLVIKDMGGDSFYKGQTAKELIEQIKRDPNAPEIRYTDAIIPETQLADLYRACDVFVSPYRGEGFSLPALEAMACGLPVIVTDGGATDDFADENTGWKIPASQRAIGRNFDGREMADEAYVLEPDADYLAGLLKDIYDNPQEIPVKGIVAALRARSEWTWNRATLKMLSRLDYLYQTTMSRDAGNVLKDTDDSNILIGRAEDLYNRGDVDGAIEHYTQAFKAGGLTEKYILHALHRMASIALADNDTELATDFIFKADEIRAGHVDTIYLYSLCLGLQEKWTEAQEQLTEILNHWKEFRFDTTLGLTLDMLLCDTARALLSTGAVEEAHEIYSEALKMNPESADACYGVAQCFKSFGDHEEARSMLEWAVKLRPDFTLAVEELDIIRN